jgi:L-aminopeptidase/D-esterase-like protein
MHNTHPIPGFRLGHWTCTLRPTGCTVVLCPQGAVASVDVRGAAPGTRETDLLAPENTVDQVHAVLLTGGSAFGLDAATGVMRWLEERGHGFKVGPATVPIVPAAVLFDLWHPLQHIRPDAQAGYAACEAAQNELPTFGAVGAGAGATVGKFFGPHQSSSGGIGYAHFQVGALEVAALVAVNALGDVIDEQGQVMCGARTPDGQFEHTAQAIRSGRILATPEPGVPAGSATTIGVVMTNAILTKTQCKKIAQMAHDGLARSISPIHTAFDGDALFCLTSGAVANTNMTAVGALAADAVAQAVRHAVNHGKSNHAQATQRARSSLP